VKKPYEEENLGIFVELSISDNLKLKRDASVSIEV
jgi:hypothetical protein